MDYIDQIQKTLEYIENHLSDEITLDELASYIFCSKFHYHRIFQSMVGEPTNEYIRKRRLSTAAKMLMNSEKNIIDIALECGYNTQVSFTKAFKKVYGINPGKYKHCKDAVTLYEKVCLIGREFEITHQGITIGPKIIKRDEIKLVGIKYVPKPGYIKTQIVNELFHEMFCRISEIPSKINQDIRVGNCYFDLKNDHLIYLASTEVSSISNIPKGMEARIIPACTYAVFTHKSLFEKNIHTFSYVYGTWFPNSGYQRNSDIGLIECFNPNFKENSATTIEMAFALK